MRHVFYTEMSVTHSARPEMIPGGGTEMVYFTTVVEAQDYADVPENGIYRDRTYRITKCFRSEVPGHRGQLVGHRSEPW